MSRVYINNSWLFTPEWSEAFLAGDYNGAQSVRLPHTVRELPFNYCDEMDYQMLSGYATVLTPSPEWRGKRVFICFEGAAHQATVYVNGKERLSHGCGYTEFSVELTQELKSGESCTVAVKLDSRESLDIPPFGYVIDYMTYGGIYREVYLEIRDEISIADVFCPYKKLEKEGEWLLMPRFTVTGELPEGATVKQTLRSKSGAVVCESEAVLSLAGEQYVPECISEGWGNSRVYEAQLPVSGVKSWSTDEPELYQVVYRIQGLADETSVRLGFRIAQFNADGFYLNGKKLKLRGLNRHQCYPYVGYAMPASMQRRDADICKYELGLNAVRTSHYPQSHHFIERCDELGLLVFTEIPGWQHLGDEAWKEQVVRNTQEMIVYYRNHTSIILWGVRVNESLDCNELYSRTNALAHRLDPSRQTSGVRYLQNSSLLEDVYAHNDFSYFGGDGPALRSKAEAFGKDNINKLNTNGYFVSEYNGHMFPTKMYDCDEHRREHSMRHLNVLRDMYAHSDIAGCFGWCMFDYNTHKDFGGGDRICYHGVTDMFRNPKMAAAVYASQSDEGAVCELTNSMALGEHPAGQLGEIYCLTNADYVKLYKNDQFVAEFKPDRENYGSLPHPPMHINDLIGELIKTNEGYKPAVADKVTSAMKDIARYGYDVKKLPLKAKLKLAGLMLFNGFTVAQGRRLYERYIGNWGGSIPTYRIEAYRNGKLVKTIHRAPPMEYKLKIDVDRTELKEGDCYDVAAVRLAAVDGRDTQLPMYQEALRLETEGAIELIGPEIVAMKGGAFGCYVKTTGAAGKGRLSISGVLLGESHVDFTVV